jgi:hypothetical protein
MDPTREPRPAPAEPDAPRDLRSDDAVVAYLRARAPGAPTARFDARAITSQASSALRRRRRRIRTSVLALAGAAAAYLALASTGPLPVPGLGTVSAPGGDALRALVERSLPGGPPGSDQWQSDVGRLETEVLPVVEELELSYYLLEPEPCHVLEYPRGDYRDGDPEECGDLVPFDAQARADFDAVTEAVERSDVAVERIYRDRYGIHIPLEDYSWQYNWEYVYLTDTGSPPPTRLAGEEWTHIQGDWWFFRAHDD